MHAFQAAMDVAQEFTQFATNERVENGEMFRLTLLAMRQYLELYALLSGPRGGGGVKPIAVTYYEFEQALPLLKKWGVRVGDVQVRVGRLLSIPGPAAHHACVCACVRPRLGASTHRARASCASTTLRVG